MKYKILIGFFSEDLEEKVNEEIENGWEPLGGVSSANENNREYIQAMIRR